MAGDSEATASVVVNCKSLSLMLYSKAVVTTTVRLRILCSLFFFNLNFAQHSIQYTSATSDTSWFVQSHKVTPITTYAKHLHIKEDV